MKAGLAFSNTKTALAHALSYQITSHYGISHGIASSFSLPAILKAVIAIDPTFTSILTPALGKQAHKNLLSFYQQIGLETKISAYGIRPDEHEDIKATVRQNERSSNFKYDSEGCLAEVFQL
jgi:alcohol dehydrogenase class IV